MQPNIKANYTSPAIETWMWIIEDFKNGVLANGRCLNRKVGWQDASTYACHVDRVGYWCKKCFEFMSHPYASQCTFCHQNDLVPTQSLICIDKLPTLICLLKEHYDKPVVNKMTQPSKILTGKQLLGLIQHSGYVVDDACPGTIQSILKTRRQRLLSRLTADRQRTNMLPVTTKTWSWWQKLLWRWFFNG